MFVLFLHTKRYYDYLADEKGYRIVGHRKAYINHENEITDNEVVDDERSSANEIIDKVKRKVIKRRRARKTNNIFNDRNLNNNISNNNNNINNNNSNNNNNNSNRFSRRLGLERIDNL